MASIDQLRKQLLGECSQSDFLAAVNAALIDHPNAPFPTMNALLTFLNRRDSEGASQVDRAYRTLLRGLRTSTDSRWRSLVLAGMLPGIARIFFANKFRENRPDDLWEEIIFAFSESVESLHESQMQSHVAYNLCLETRKRVRGHRAEEERDMVSLEEDDFEPPVEMNTANVILELVMERAVKKGALTLKECSLILATEVYGLSFAEVAVAEGTPEASLRQRKSRAMERLKKFVAGNRT